MVEFEEADDALSEADGDLDAVEAVVGVDFGGLAREAGGEVLLGDDLEARDGGAGSFKNVFEGVLAEACEVGAEADDLADGDDAALAHDKDAADHAEAAGHDVEDAIHDFDESGAHDEGGADFAERVELGLEAGGGGGGGWRGGGWRGGGGHGYGKRMVARRESSCWISRVTWMVRGGRREAAMSGHSMTAASAVSRSSSKPRSSASRSSPRR